MMQYCVMGAQYEYMNIKTLTYTGGCIQKFLD